MKMQITNRVLRKINTLKTINIAKFVNKWKAKTKKKKTNQHGV